MEIGIERNKATIMKDIAVHAATEAILTLMRITTTAPDGAKGNTALLALGILIGNIESVAKEIQKRD
jgi:hypothetical protein